MWSNNFIIVVLDKRRSKKHYIDNKVEYKKNKGYSQTSTFENYILDLVV